MNTAKSNSKKRPSMKDVAEAAAVSQTTVSLVINNVEGAGIADETAQRVWAAVKNLGYRPNAIARGLRRAQTDTIAFISDLVATTPYAGNMIQGAQEAAWAAGKLLLLVNTGGDDGIEKRAIDMMLDRQVDGFVYASMYHRPVTPPLGDVHVPVVVLDAFDSEGRFSSVVPDDEQGGFDATQLLLDHGHRRIAFINSSNPIPAATLRLAGYANALEAREIEPASDIILDVDISPTGGYEATRRLLTLPDPPTAIFCFNDRVAMGAYRAIGDARLRIPEDISVVGFDDQVLIAAWLDPPLTTIALPHHAMGCWAVNHLLSLLADGSGEPIRALESCPVVLRNSVAHPPTSSSAG